MFLDVESQVKSSQVIEKERKQKKNDTEKEKNKKKRFSMEKITCT